MCCLVLHMNKNIGTYSSCLSQQQLQVGSYSSIKTMKLFITIGMRTSDGKDGICILYTYILVRLGKKQNATSCRLLAIVLFYKFLFPIWTIPIVLSAIRKDLSYIVLCCMACLQSPCLNRCCHILDNTIGLELIRTMNL